MALNIIIIPESWQATEKLPSSALPLGGRTLGRRKPLGREGLSCAYSSSSSQHRIKPANARDSIGYLTINTTSQKVVKRGGVGLSFVGPWLGCCFGERKSGIEKRVVAEVKKYINEASTEDFCTVGFC